MVTKTYIPSYLCDSSDGIDSSDRSGSSDSSDNSYSSESSDRSNSCDSGDQNLFFPPSKTYFTKTKKLQKKILPLNFFHNFFFFHQELLFIKTNIYLPKNIVKLQISPKNFFSPIFVHYKKCYHFFLSPKHFFTQN